MILVMVVGLGIGLGLAALTTFSTGQDQEAKRRITQLKQTAAIQYATDYQTQKLFKKFNEVTNASGAARILDNTKTLKTADSSLLSTCLADMPWGTPPHNQSGSVAALWNSNKESDSAQLITAGTEQIPGLDHEVHYAFEHYGRELDTLVLDEDSWIELRQLNDVAYDEVFFDIWFQVDFEDKDLFPETDTNEYEIPLASFYTNTNSDPEISVYAKLSICDQSITKENRDDEKAVACKRKEKKTRGIFTYHVKQDSGPDEHLEFDLVNDDNTMKSIEDGYWQYASFNIDLPDNIAEANFIAVPQTAFDTFGDKGSAKFGSLKSFEKDGVWKIGDHSSVDSSSPITIGSLRFWRQPSLNDSEAKELTEELFEADREKPGTFDDTTLGTPDAVVLAEGTWSQQRELPVENDKFVRQMRGSWWGPALGGVTLITSKSAAAQETLFDSYRQLFSQKRPSDARSGPPAPTQIYRLFSCDEKGGAGRVEYHRHSKRSGTEFTHSWEEHK